jgi:hypothetical protein
MFLGHGDDLSFVVSGVSFDALAKCSTACIETAGRPEDDLRDPGAAAEGFANMNVRKAALDCQPGPPPTNLLDSGRRSAAPGSRYTGARTVGIGSAERVNGDHRAEVRRAPPDFTGEPS